MRGAFIWQFLFVLVKQGVVSKYIIYLKKLTRFYISTHSYEIFSNNLDGHCKIVVTLLNNKIYVVYKFYSK